MKKKGKNQIRLYITSKLHRFNDGICDQCGIQCTKLRFRFRCPRCGKDFERKPR